MKLLKDAGHPGVAQAHLMMSNISPYSSTKDLSSALNLEDAYVN